MPNKRGEECIWHVQTKDGVIWRNDNTRKTKAERKEEWWRLVKEDGSLHKLEDGNAIASAYQREFAKQGPNKRALAASPSMQPITTKEEFIAKMVGKTWYHYKNTNLVYNADGTYSGSHNGKPFSATWEWKGKYFCRVIDGKKKEDCKLRFASADGQYAKEIGNKGQGSISYFRARK